MSKAKEIIEQPTLYKYYAITNDKNIVIDLFSEPFAKDRKGIFIGEYGTKHVGHIYQLTDDNGIYLYCIVDGEMVERTEADKKAELLPQRIEAARLECERVIFSRFSQGVQNGSMQVANRINYLLSKGEEIPAELEAEIPGIEEAERWMGEIKKRYQAHKANLQTLQHYSDVVEYALTYDIEV